MLKSIFVATIMTTVFTFVAVSTVTITSDQAFAGKKEKKEKKKAKKKTIKRISVTAKRASQLYEFCLLSNPKPSTNSLNVTLSCCADNDKGKRWCVTCYGGSTIKPDNCSVVTKALVRYPGSLKPKPGQGQLAPTKGKPKKTRPSSTGTMNTVPMKQYKMAPLAPKEFIELKIPGAADKPKTGPTINKNRIQ